MSDLLARIRKELESARERSRLLEQENRDQKRVNEALKYVTSVVLHEVKLPLGGAREGVRKLLQGLAENDRLAIDQSVKMLEQQLSQLEYVLARLDPAFELAGSHDVAIDLADLVQNVFETVTAVTGYAVRLVNNIQSELPSIHCDQSKLQEILLNLVENGVRHIGDGDRLEVDSMDVGELIRIRVIDNGIGLPVEIKDALLEGDFDRIVRVNRQAGRGGGLGLAIVQRLVRELEGSISFPDRSEGFCVEILLPRFRSQEDETYIGTDTSAITKGRDEEVAATISVSNDPASDLLDAVPLNDAVRLPALADARELVADETVVSRPRREHARILLVDDDRELTRYLADGFPDHEFEVEIAVEGPQGLRRAEEILPDLIVLDVLMVGMNGFEVLTRLKSNPQTRDIPVVMLSNVRGEAKALKLGAAAYLQKPVTHEALLQLVRRMLTS